MFSFSRGFSFNPLSSSRPFLLYLKSKHIKYRRFIYLITTVCWYGSISRRISFHVLTIDKCITLRNWKYKYLSKICAFYFFIFCLPCIDAHYVIFIFFLYIFLPIAPTQHLAFSDFIFINIAQNACFIGVF